VAEVREGVTGDSHFVVYLVAAGRVTTMERSEQRFLLVLIFLGTGFQVRLWRELAARRLVGKSSEGRQSGASFYRFGLLFCRGLEALSAERLCGDTLLVHNHRSCSSYHHCNRLKLERSLASGLRSMLC
jgi:hypothetical protein